MSRIFITVMAEQFVGNILLVILFLSMDPYTKPSTTVSCANDNRGN
ncbi:MAG: hypothetical protein ACOC44_06355 [Promethearchaeia archaeon]